MLARRISGIILAGGRSMRMGVDKRWVEVLGEPLLLRAVATLRPLADDIVIVTHGEEGRLGNARIVADEIKDRGPMAGLITGVRSIRNATALVIPVDMPLLTANLLAHLAGISAGWDVTVPRWSMGIEPLVGVYAASCADAMAHFLRLNASLRDFLRSTDLRVRYVGDSELAQFGDPARLFFNINAPGDVPAAEALLRGGSHIGAGEHEVS